MVPSYFTSLEPPAARAGPLGRGQGHTDVARELATPGPPECISARSPSESLRIRRDSPVAPFLGRADRPPDRTYAITAISIRRV